MSASEFETTENKRIIRQKWNSPILSFLSTKFDRKLIYYGLPSPEAGDLNDWIEYIDIVYAFQCRDYPHPSDPSQSDDAIRALEKKLNDFNRKKQISNFFLYDGYIEEVVINGKDNINTQFSISDFVTLFNLDFCNQITSPRTILNITKKISEKVYKLHVIKKIFDKQNENKNHPYKFILFLTIHANFKDDEISNFIEHLKTRDEYKEYLVSISTLKSKEYQVRVLKLYIYETIKNQFLVNSFIPEFLPVAYYQGSGEHMLIQFTVVGTYEETKGRNATNLQDKYDFIYTSFITPNLDENSMQPLTNDKIEEKIAELDPINIFMSTKVYSDKWK